MKALFAVALLAAVIAGCGGDDGGGGETGDGAAPAGTATQARSAPGAGDEAEIRQTWRRYTKALGEEDAATVCSLLTPNGVREVLRGAADSSCEEGVASVGSFFEGFETELTDLKVQGDVAEAVSPARGQVPKQGIRFARVGEGWKIDGSSDLE